ncbi:MAG: phage portal protein, partial [Geopsychrobacter sp.]|nr:phage portal protein [Geopsychrobacter sp.]
LAFKKWGRRGTCDVTGKLSWIDIQRLALENCARDGEVLIRKVNGYDNAFNFALQLIEADLLDENLSTTLRDGNSIRMGIEFNKWDKPVAYWVLKRHPGDLMHSQTPGPAHERILAEEIIHLHAPEFVRQSRGIPWGHAAMARLKKVDIYETNEIVASGVAAGKMGFIEVHPDAEDDEEDLDDNEDVEIVSTAEAGTIEKLPRGHTFKAWDPTHPSGNYDPSMKRMMRAISSGFGVNYCSLGNDLSEVNFSSIRHGVSEDRDGYKSLQNWLVEWLCQDIYAAFLVAGMLSGQIKLPFAKLEKYQADTWRPRRWGYINPAQDATAKDKEIKGGFGTRSGALEEKGYDYEEYLETLQHEKELEQEYGVEPPDQALAKGPANGKKGSGAAGDDETVPPQYPDDMTVNERRALDGLDPITGGDAIYMSATQIPAIEIEGDA